MPSSCEDSRQDEVPLEEVKEMEGTAEAAEATLEDVELALV